MQKGGEKLNSCELVTLVSTITCIISDCIEDDNQLALLSAVFTQLGDSLNTVLTGRENNKKKDWKI